MGKKILKLRACRNNREPCSHCFQAGSGIQFCGMEQDCSVGKTKCCYRGKRIKLEVKKKG